MSEKAKWNVIIGVVGYLDDVKIKGDPARRATIETLKGGRVRATLWPQYNKIPVAVGDFIIAQGPIEEYHYEKDGSPRTSYNINVKRLNVMPNLAPAYENGKRYSEPSGDEAF